MDLLNEPETISVLIGALIVRAAPYLATIAEQKKNRGRIGRFLCAFAAFATAYASGVRDVELLIGAALGASVLSESSYRAAKDSPTLERAERALGKLKRAPEHADV